MLYTFKKVGHCVTPHCLKGVEIFEKSLKLEVGIPFSVKMEGGNHYRVVIYRKGGKHCF